MDFSKLNNYINNKFWQGIFDGQGLKQAKSQGIYNDEMTRLFTLQALILPVEKWVVLNSLY